MKHFLFILILLSAALLHGADQAAVDIAYAKHLAIMQAEPVDIYARMNSSFDFALGYPDDKRGASWLHGMEKLDDDLDAAGREAYQKALSVRLADALSLPNLPEMHRTELLGQLATQQRILGLRATPLDLKFTAVDGREVDVSKMRGKVVLIDFWSTWCGPCVAELPNVKRVYETYHSRGFEVVGVSFEWANIIDEKTAGLPQNAGKILDTPDQVTAKKEAARRKLVAFIQKSGLPYPNYFDGYWPNEFSKRWRIGAIPMTFLLGKDGRMAYFDVTGARLEEKVKQLLAQ